ncbi:MAG: hypothetical protein ACRC8A_09550 [Microcoleaceae cyanobacterium]
MVRVPEDIPEQEIDQLTPSESIVLKVISAIGLTIFTIFMVVNWHRTLSQHAAAEAAKAKLASTQTATAPFTPVSISGTSVNGTAAPETTPSQPAATATSLVQEGLATPSTILSTAAESSSPTVPNAEGTVIGSISPDITSETMAQDSGTKIIDSGQVQALSKTLSDKVNAAWTKSPTFSNNLVYLVKVQADGDISEYKPVNQSAVDFLKETPLETVTQPGTVSEAEPIAEFVLVLTPSKSLEVSPWLAE